MTRSAPPVSNAIISATVTMKKKLDSTASTALKASPMTDDDAARVERLADRGRLVLRDTERGQPARPRSAVYVSNSSLYCGSSCASRPAETSRATDTEISSR